LGERPHTAANAAVCGPPGPVIGLGTLAFGLRVPRTIDVCGTRAFSKDGCLWAAIQWDEEPGLTEALSLKWRLASGR